MDMKERILKHVNHLVAIPSVSNTAEEAGAARYLGDSLGAQAYFKANPQLTGQFPIPGDSLGRTAAYGLILGNGPRTLVLTGHYDVVDTEEYGGFRDFAYDVAAWQQVSGRQREELLQMLTPQAAEDLESGEWLFGRGSNDMKGGLAIGLALMEEIGDRCLSGDVPDGNLLFLAVADEEAYSAGMRAASALLAELAGRCGLEYSCLIDLEPCFGQGGKQEVHIGSVGKLLPAVLVQGAKAHVVECFGGLNAVGVLAQLFMDTELAPEFAESCHGEMCPPPTWFNLRDRKEGYDVSVPLRAAGYMSVLGFEKTAGTVMKRLGELGRQAFSKYLERMRNQACALGGESSGMEEMIPAVDLDSCVLEYRELEKITSKKMGNAAFAQWREQQYREAGEKIHAGEWSYPQATLEMMDRLLTCSGITVPVMVLAFAPPYYPAYHSDRIPGREGEGSAAYELLRASALEKRGIQLEKWNYFCGISDLSYCGGLEGDAVLDYGADTPLWGSLYSMDQESMNRVQIPALLFGPVGMDAHQMGERVNIRSLTEDVPEILLEFIGRMFGER